MTKIQKILELNAFDMNRTEGLDPEVAALIARRKRTFGPMSMLFYQRPLHVVRGDGVWLYAADGSRHLDAYNNVPSIGHCHPRVTEAVAKQMATLNTHTRYLYDIVYTYAERLLSTFPRETSNVVFTCTGSESVDLALRIARHVTGGTGFIATENAYHGNTTTATQISPSSASTESENSNIYFVPAPDTYRSGHSKAGPMLAASVGEAIADMKKKGIRFAGMIADSIFASDGVYPGTPGFINDTVKVVRDAGGLYIADEVQPGFWRTGAAMWDLMRHNFVPDMVVLGKPMGNGYPIGGLVVKPELLTDFGKKSGYFNTFGGNPVASAAGLAVLEVLEEEDLGRNSRETGAYLLSEMKRVAEKYECVGDVRGAGLYLAVEFVRNRETREHDKDMAVRTINDMRERGVLLGTEGRQGNIWKVRPPLCFSRENADFFVDGFAATLAANT
jgi:4-aminobutyrate aminotransferase-like enzyme